MLVNVGKGVADNTPVTDGVTVGVFVAVDVTVAVGGKGVLEIVAVGVAVVDR